MQKIKAEEAPKLAAHQDAIFLEREALRAGQGSLRSARNLGLDPESRYLVERYWLNFVRAGAQLSEADKATLRALNQEEAKLTTEFTDKVLADTNESAVVVDDRGELSGLGEGGVAAAAEKAKERKLAGKWVLTLQNTTQQPALASLANRALRERLFQASALRCNHGGGNDTKAIVARLAELRAQRAKLLGYANYAAFTLDDQMAKTPQNAEKLMTGLVPAATAKARGEAARMQKLIDAEKGAFPLGAADWEFYAEKVRKAEYDLDESQVAPYFELDRVLRDGVFFAANRLYGITFQERKDIPVYQPDVRVFEVFDADGKSAGALLRRLLLALEQERRRLAGQLRGPEPSPRDEAGGLQRDELHQARRGQPALISFDDVTTLFHEFGHALHAHVRERPLPDALERAARLRRVPVAVQRALGARAVGPRQLREALPDRQADAAGARGQDQEVPHVQPGLQDDRVSRAPPFSTWPGTSCPPERRQQDVNAFERAALRAIPRGPAAGAAALPHDLFLAHLAGRLRGRLLRVPLERGDRRRRLLLVQGERRHDPRERKALPRDDPLPRRHAGSRRALPRVPRPRPEGRAADRGARPQAGGEVRLGVYFTPSTRKRWESWYPNE